MNHFSTLTSCENLGKRHITRTSLVVQWLRIRLAKQETWVQALVGEVRSHVPGSNLALNCWRLLSQQALEPASHN